MECAIYDRETGQLLSGSLSNYALPRAVDVPDVEWHDNGLPSRGAADASARDRCMGHNPGRPVDADRGLSDSNPRIRFSERPTCRTMALCFAESWRRQHQ
jgi:hypothetical protein